MKLPLPTLLASQPRNRQVPRFSWMRVFCTFTLTQACGLWSSPPSGVFRAHPQSLQEQVPRLSTPSLCLERVWFLVRVTDSHPGPSVAGKQPEPGVTPGCDGALTPQR